ncbi:MAG: hypothetical protein A3E37_00980 [Candidatus Andersenbacteria bacterium RIFCSPHIGHO2_12_FULL_46_9]|nr:MAG: hypothetical protein UW94_C0015G0002 [Parcubacteria group bacterium GW2011_GWA2_45_14]OGY33358.1 MAG: hypothetical protein A3B76_02435 [Candidatus Andersenbacteria bacterium RIFCSPHIGHO2_02_FULL_46_16]OGY35605.1 MAG: hypothetical protein A3E37_00980 [Candidatus Andersenbacteria bacterium RIFCSPHIGHO2_12_FULL_46_9]OGY36457.1 MAG: hypothetical protein A3I08_01435 [Candidatus Andersenbacteria bacterium RIFCSPLOWO2_02_FULL_46_11]
MKVLTNEIKYAQPLAEPNFDYKRKQIGTVTTSTLTDAGTGTHIVGDTGIVSDLVGGSVITIDPFSAPYTQSSFSDLTVSTDSLLNGFLQSSGAQNAYVEWRVNLQPGTWTVSIMAKKANNMGTMTVALDGTSLGTIDWYAASDAANQVASITGVSVTEGGTKLLRLTMADKNGSSSNYVGRVQSLKLLRTA